MLAKAIDAPVRARLSPTSMSKPSKATDVVVTNVSAAPAPAPAPAAIARATRVSPARATARARPDAAADGDGERHQPASRREVGVEAR